MFLVRLHHSLLFYKMERDYWSIIKSVMVFLGRYPEKETDSLKQIKINEQIIKELRDMTNGIAEMGTFGGNVGPINTPVTGKGAVAGFDPIMKFSKRATKSRKKKESAGKQWEHRRR